MTRVYLEESRTPIYRRIALSLGRELARRGHEVMLVKPDGFDAAGYLRFVRDADAAAVYVANAGSNWIQQAVPAGLGAGFAFESFGGRVVFLHQDTLLGGLPLLDALARLQAWRRIAHRSVHLCIEDGNVADLQAVGIGAAWTVPHASEFAARPPSTDHFDHGASFVGHVVPQDMRAPMATPMAQALADEAWALRQADLTAPLQPHVKARAAQACALVGDAAERPLMTLACAQWLRNQVTGLSMPMRGWLLHTCALSPLTVVGGDPAYLHGVDRQARLARAGIRYEPARFEPEALAAVYRHSQVSLNLSSMQFDRAVVNRVHDVFLAGGLCLTDALPGLAELTRHHAEIGCRTVEELRDKAVHFSQPQQRQARASLIREVQRDIEARSGYARVVDRMEHALGRLAG